MYTVMTCWVMPVWKILVFIGFQWPISEECYSILLLFFPNGDKSNWWSHRAYLHVVNGANPLSHWVIEPYPDIKESHCQFSHALFLRHGVMEHSFGRLSTGRDGCGICKCQCFKHFMNNWRLLCPSLAMWRCKRKILLRLDYSFCNSYTPSLQQLLTAHVKHGRIFESEVLFADLLVIVVITLPVTKRIY